MSSYGVAAMVECAAWLQGHLDMEVLSIGRSADNTTEDCVLEICGRWLTYRISLRGGWVWLSVQLADRADEPEFIVNAADGGDGWRRIGRLVCALERAQVKSLQRPIEAGEFVIG
jgi:hypothetical protein